MFTEQQYFDFFNDPTAQFNDTFLYLLREHPCVFIGLSMHDDNIRRLLHYSRSERRHAYGEEQAARGRGRAGGRRGVRRPGDDDPSRRHFAVLRHSNSAVVDALTERSLADLGTTVAWVDSYGRIPDELARVYQTGSAGRWKTVYDEDAASVTRRRPSPGP